MTVGSIKLRSEQIHDIVPRYARQTSAWKREKAAVWIKQMREYPILGTISVVPDGFEALHININ